MPLDKNREDLILIQIASLRELMSAQHKHVRDDIYEIRSEMKEREKEMRQHEDYDNETRRLVEEVRTERRIEEKQMLRRGTWAALFVSVGISGLVKVLEGLFHR